MQVLTSEWFAAVDAGLESLEIEPGRAVVIGQEVTGGPAGTVRYRVVVADGRARLIEGDDPPADVTISTPWPLAVEIAEGTTSAQHAFLRGALRIGGDPRVLIEHADVAAAIGRVTSTIR